MNNPKDMLVSEPLSSEWIAYVISTRTEEGAINVISMAAAKLRSERDELVGALGGLVRINEEHNDAIAKVMGKPLGWKDDYLDQARAILSKHKPE
jgi:hypothetical protein